MKRKILNYLLLIATIVFLNSCSKEQDELIQNQKCSGILYFSNAEEYKTSLNNVLKFNQEELALWEQQNGFKSFGLTAEKFYNSIDQESFKDIDEFKQFVKENENYLLLLEENGDYILETRFYNNPLRYLMNEEKLFQIGTKIYKLFDEGTLCADIENIDKLKSIEEQNYNSFRYDSDIIYFDKIIDFKSTNTNCGSGSIDAAQKQNGGDWYMTKLEFICKNSNISEGSAATCYYKASSYKRGFLWIYYLYSSTISININSKLHYLHNDYGNTIVNYEDSKSVIGKSTEGIKYFNSSNNHDYDSKPYYISFYCTANNGKTDNVTLSCTSN